MSPQEKTALKEKSIIQLEKDKKMKLSDASKKTIDQALGILLSNLEQNNQTNQKEI